MLFSRSEGCEVEPPRDTSKKGFGNLYRTYINVFSDFTKFGKSFNKKFA